MAKNGIVTDYDDSGFPQVAAFTENVAYTALPAVVKGSPGRVCKVTVTTTTAGGAITVSDGPTGTPLLVIPIAAAAGTIYDVNLPAFSSINVSGSAATAGAVTIGYS